jgi:hypothetical protein
VFWGLRISIVLTRLFWLSKVGDCATILHLSWVRFLKPSISLINLFWRLLLVSVPLMLGEAFSWPEIFYVKGFFGELGMVKV